MDRKMVRETEYIRTAVKQLMVAERVLTKQSDELKLGVVQMFHGHDKKMVTYRRVSMNLPHNCKSFVDMFVFRTFLKMDLDCDTDNNTA